MPRTYTGTRGSSAQPMLADYLRANTQQGAQQAGALAQGLMQEGQQARSAVDDAQAHVSLSRLGSTGDVSPYEAQRALSRPDVDLAGAAVDASALQQQVGRATADAGLANSAGGIGALNAMKYGSAAPRSAGASMFDAAVAQNAGGRQIRAAARPMGGLQEYLSGAVGRGNADATAKAQAILDAQPKAPAAAPTPQVVAGPAITQAAGNLTSPESSYNHLFGLRLGKKKVRP